MTIEIAYDIKKPKFGRKIRNEIYWGLPLIAIEHKSVRNKQISN